MNTKEKIRKLGKELLLKRGYSAFSFADISTPLGIKNAAIHYYYPSKESLGVDILRNEQQRFTDWKAFGKENSLSYEEQLERFFEIYEESLNLDLSICLVGSVSTHFANVPPAMREELDILVSDITEWLVNLVSTARADNAFYFKGNSASMAHAIASSMSGSLQLSRVKGPDFFKSVKENIKLQLGL